MTLLAWCQKETNREQRYALDKRWIPSEGREGIERRGKEPIWSACLSFSKNEFFITAYKYINETLKDIIKHFHSPCLLCAGWGGKQKGSKHICISESLVPRELLWAVSANLFSELLTAHQQQNHSPTPLVPGQIFQQSSYWCSWIWGWQIWFRISWFQMAVHPFSLSFLRFKHMCPRSIAEEGSVCVAAV